MVTKKGTAFTVPYGGAKEDRTPDPLLAKQVLSQLSYNPMYINPKKNGGPEWI